MTRLNAPFSSNSRIRRGSSRQRPAAITIHKVRVRPAAYDHKCDQDGIPSCRLSVMLIFSIAAQSSRLAVFGGCGMSFNICRGTSPLPAGK